MILPDYPIRSEAEDKLRRVPLAKKVAQLITNFKGTESFVIGIEGVWGSGKTSFVNLVVDGISKNRKFILVEFNPWNFTDQNELIKDFFSTIISHLTHLINDDESFKKLRSLVSKLTRKTEYNLSPEISFLGLKLKVPDLVKSKKVKSLAEERKEIDDLFRSLEKKVVIVIDDIDRLDSEETRLIMKLVKMTANFPNTIFILCYDREKVVEKLNTEVSGEEYLKKIIQVSFTLPLPSEEGISKILYNDLDETIQSIYDNVNLIGNDEIIWGKLQRNGFLYFFKTIRDIKRYISSLRLNWSIIEKEDINMVDFMAIELIRVFAPTLYSGIAGNENLFTGAGVLYISKENHKKELNAKFEDLIKNFPVDLKLNLRSICEIIFPNLSNAYHASGNKYKWKLEKRIASSEKFRFYFELGIPDGKISEVDVNALALTFNEKEIFKHRILELFEENKLRQMLSKVVDRTSSLTQNEVKVIISTLWELHPIIGKEKTEIFDFEDVRSQTGRIAYHSLKNIPTQNRFQTLEEVLKDCTHIYPAIRFVGSLIDILIKPDGYTDPLITNEEAEKLKNYFLLFIKKLVDENKLLDEQELMFILYRWKEWENEEAVKDFIKNIISSTTGLLLFLKRFVSLTLSTQGNYNNIDKSLIGKLYPINEIETLIENIPVNELSNLKEDEKEALELFKSPREKHWVTSN